MQDPNESNDMGPLGPFCDEYCEGGLDHKICTARMVIFRFRGDDSEDLFDMWLRFDLTRMMHPQHQWEKWEILHCFCDGITDQARSHLNSLFGGSYLDCTPDELERGLELLSRMNEKWRSPTQKKEAEDEFNTILTTINDRVLRWGRTGIVEPSAQTPMDEVMEEVSDEKIEVVEEQSLPLDAPEAEISATTEVKNMSSGLTYHDVPDTFVRIPELSQDLLGNFDPISRFFFPSDSSAFSIYMLPYRVSSILQRIMEHLELKRRGAKDGLQSALYGGKSARDSFPFDNG